MPKKSKIAILIMAAGGSTRMGSPKQLLKWGNSNLLNHTITFGTKLESERIFVVLGSKADQIIPEIKSKKLNILINENWQKGLGNSISLGVSSILKVYPNLDGILIILVDQPLINLDHYLKLINAFSKGKDQIIATKYKDGKLGVPALFDLVYFKDLCLLNSNFGAKQLIGKYLKHVISFKSDKSDFDIDTLDEYEILYKANH